MRQLLGLLIVCLLCFMSGMGYGYQVAKDRIFTALLDISSDLTVEARSEICGQPAREDK